ncbi:MAG: hypothetical protein IT432_13815 [Phycisphaerales bacterium]|nr:hypothetical protein [Phycisphaerales bacterium]
MTIAATNGVHRTRAEATRIPVAREYSGPATEHILNLGDARALGWIPDESVHLVVTSPPYFNLKEYNKHPGQLGEMDDYEAFHDALDEVWEHCYRVLVPGGGEAGTIVPTRKRPR